MGIEDIFVFFLVIEHYIRSKKILYRGEGGVGGGGGGGGRGELGRLFGSNKILSRNFPATCIFSHFPSLSLPFSLAKHPTRMITQRMSV